MNTIPSTGTFFTYHANDHHLASLKHPVRFVKERKEPNPQFWDYGGYHDLDKLLESSRRRGLPWDMTKVEDVEWMDPLPAMHPLGYADETRRLLQEARSVGSSSMPSHNAHHIHYDTTTIDPVLLRLENMQINSDREDRYNAASRRQRPLQPPPQPIQWTYQPQSLLSPSERMGRGGGNMRERDERGFRNYAEEQPSLSKRRSIG